MEMVDVKEALGQCVVEMEGEEEKDARCVGEGSSPELVGETQGVTLRLPLSVEDLEGEMVVEIVGDKEVVVQSVVEIEGEEEKDEND